MQIVNFGSMNLDHVYQMPRFIRGGETLLSGGLADVPGGKGLNQSIAVARSGAAVRHAGMLGVGGEPLRACLEAAGVDTALLVPCGAPQGHTVIQVDPSGENCIIVFGGSNRLLGREHIDAVLDTLAPGDFVLAQNEISNLAYLLPAAAGRGLRVVLNASPIDDALLALDLSGLAWLVINELECAALSGQASVQAGYEALKARYPNVGILLTLGEGGSVSWQDGREVRQAAFPVRAVDTTAAGDTFLGYFVGCLAQGMARQEAMALASMAAAIAVTRPGAAPSIPTMAEVRAALRKR